VRIRVELIDGFDRWNERRKK
jgi:hypothetical protein